MRIFKTALVTSLLSLAVCRAEALTERALLDALSDIIPSADTPAQAWRTSELPSMGVPQKEGAALIQAFHNQDRQTVDRLIARLLKKGASSHKSFKKKLKKKRSSL